MGIANFCGNHVACCFADMVHRDLSRTEKNRIVQANINRVDTGVFFSHRLPAEGIW